MAANILDTPVNRTSAMNFTPSAGASYALIWAVRRSSSGTVDPVSSVTLGGQSATLVAGYSTGSGYLRSIGGLWAINESQIAAMSGDAIVTTGGFGTALVFSLSITGTAQVLPASGEFGQVNPADSVSATLDRSIDLNRTTDGITLAFQHWSGVSNAVTMVDPSRDVNISDAGSTASIAYQTDTTTGLLASSWNSVDTTRHASFLAVSFKPAPSQAITSVNDDDEVNAGAVNTAQVAGYVVGVNPVVSGTVGSLALASVSQVGSEVFFTPPAPVNAAYWPEPDGTETLTLTDGAFPSTFSAPFRPIPGYTSVVVASPDNADEYKLGYWATTPPVNGDRIMADFPVDPDTSFSGATDGLHIWYHWVSATSTMYIYEATIGGGVIIDNRGLSVAGVSVTGLSVPGLSVTGL